MEVNSLQWRSIFNCRSHYSVRQSQSQNLWVSAPELSSYEVCVSDTKHTCIKRTMVNNCYLLDFSEDIIECVGDLGE